MHPYPNAVKRFPRLRQSRLATLDRCALSASFDEEYRHDWTGHPQARGQIFHRVAAKALRAMHEAGENTIPTDAAIAILDETLRQHDVDVECGDCGSPIVAREGGRVRCEQGHEHRSDFVNLPMSEVKDLRWIVVKFAHDNAFDIENLVDVEHRLNSTITYPDGQGGYVDRLLTGQLDAVFVQGEEDDEAIVLDFKDTWALPAPAEVGFDGYFQQRFYAWLIFRNYPSIQKVTLREFYVRYSEAREAVVWRHDIEDVEAELSALAERFDRAFEERNFPPSPGAHCQFCPRPGACPIFPGVRGEGAIQDEPTALRFAAEANVAKAALDQRKKALSAWASVHGHIPISDHKGQRVWGHRETQRVARPDRASMEEALALAGASGRVDLDALYKRSKTTRFEPHQPAEIEDTADDAALMGALEESIQRASK